MPTVNRIDPEPAGPRSADSGGTASTVAVVAPRGASTRLRAALAAEALRVVGHTGSSDELHRLPAQPDVVVVLPDLLGLEVVEGTREVARLAPGARIVVVAPALELRTLRALLAVGVDAVVLERDVERSLGLAVRCACQGQLSFPESLRRSLARPALSTREKQVLGMVVLGMSNAEIARKLHLAESTVKTHLRSSFAKLGVRSRNEAAQLILDPEGGLGSGILRIGEGE